MFSGILQNSFRSWDIIFSQSPKVLFWTKCAFPLKECSHETLSIFWRKANVIFWNELTEIWKLNICFSCHFVTAADLLHIRKRNLDWCKCGHCKNEARKIDCLCCREVNVMLLLRLKSWNAREACRHADLIGNCLLLVTRVCFIYVGYGFYLSLSGFNQVEWGREMSPRFPFAIPRFESFSSDLLRARSHNVVCVQCL